MWNGLDCKYSALVLKEVSGNNRLSWSWSTLQKRRKQVFYQSMAVEQRSGSWFWCYTCSAVAGQKKDVSSRNKTKARIPVILFFSETSGIGRSQNSALFLPVLFINVVITELFSFDLLFYRGFSQYAVLLDLGVITNHILHVGHLAFTPIYSCL